ncbi:VOC family protein [Streptomyces sp. CC210A]|uniref:VOC family protein n=1 Tax=Streptomyces sp. CC210A TaxID=2898184 RepID=UPI001F46CEE4|nr:VOC family protein [Streptomyces sp. CC210A]
MTAHTDDSPFSALGRVVVLVDDQDAALAFCRDVLGFRVLHDGTAGGHRFPHIGLPGQEPAGVWLMASAGDREREPAGRQSGGRPLLVLYASDLDAVRERLRRHGVRVRGERDEADSRSLHLAGLCGNVIIAAELRAPAA